MYQRSDLFLAEDSRMIRCPEGAAAVLLIAEGKGTAVLNLRRTRVSAGQAILLRSEDACRLSTASTMTVNALVFPLAYLDDGVAEEINAVFEPVCLKLEEEETEFIRATLMHLAHGACRMPEKSIEAVCDAMIAHYPDRLGNDDLRLIVAYANRRYREPLSLDDAARMINLSPVYFSAFFKRKMKTGFAVYVRNVRLERAAVRLVFTDEDLRVLAENTGFHSYAYFAKCFFERYKETPKHFRSFGRDHLLI